MESLRVHANPKRVLTIAVLGALLTVLALSEAGQAAAGARARARTTSNARCRARPASRRSKRHRRARAHHRGVRNRRTQLCESTRRRSRRRKARGLLAPRTPVPIGAEGTSGEAGSAPASGAGVLGSGEPGAVTLQEQGSSVQGEQESGSAREAAELCGGLQGSALLVCESAGGPQLTWTSPSSPPLSDAEAAARVVDRPEQRAGNAAANDYVPTDAELSLFHTEAASFNPLSAYVDGRDGLTDPSTDDLIQWASLKWGIPTDWLRAEYVGESGWDEGVLGDRKKVSPEWWALYPPQARLANDEVFETMGIAGVRWTPGPNLAEGDSQPINPGTEPLRWESTAFNVDYQASVLRYYYDGLCWWCGEGYVAGKAWDSVGAWYSGTWYHAGAAEYTGEVRST